MDLRINRFITDFELPEPNHILGNATQNYNQMAIFSPCGSFVFTCGLSNNLYVHVFLI